MDFSSETWSVVVRTWYSSVDDNDITRSELPSLLCIISIEFESVSAGFCKERRTVGIERMIAWDGDIGEWRNDRERMRDDECN